MDRGTFVKILASGTGSLLLSGIGLNQEFLKYDLQKVKIYDNYVRGVNFRKSDFLSVQLKINDPLELEREHTNQFDQYAIKVLRKGIFIGYIAAYENIVLAMLLDQGVQLEASVSNIKSLTGNEKYIDKVFSVQVYTKLLVPYQQIDITDLSTKRADDAEDIYRQGKLIK